MFSEVGVERREREKEREREREKEWPCVCLWLRKRERESKRERAPWVRKRGRYSTFTYPVRWPGSLNSEEPLRQLAHLWVVSLHFYFTQARVRSEAVSLSLARAADIWPNDTFQCTLDRICDLAIEELNIYLPWSGSSLVNLIKHFTIVIYKSIVVLTTNLPILQL